MIFISKINYNIQKIVFVEFTKDNQNQFFIYHKILNQFFYILYNNAFTKENAGTTKRVV